MRAVAGAIVLFALALRQGPPPTTRPAATIYSSRAGDPWNQVFALLFTRSFQTRFTDEFGGRGPFELQRGLPAVPAARVSTRTFDRFEEGDRAVDALYPAFLNQIGPHDALKDPLHADLMKTLNAAMEDRT